MCGYTLRLENAARGSGSFIALSHPLWPLQLMRTESRLCYRVTGQAGRDTNDTLEAARNGRGMLGTS